MAATERIVLVTGGTGKQGGATVAELLRGGRVRVRVLTRDVHGAGARALAGRGVEVVGGDFDDRSSLDRALSGVDAAFSVQHYREGGVEAEERRGMAFADAAKAAGVELLVYASVDGAERHSGVPHFESKRRIEEHIAGLGLRATILRPTAFMEGLAGPPLARAAFLGLLRGFLGDAKPLQLVATADIGWFAARALEEPARFAGRTIALAGDELTVPQILEAFRRVDGRRPGVLPVPRPLLRLVPEGLASMLRWFPREGYRADIPAVRAEHPSLLSFEQFLGTVRQARTEVRPAA